MKRLTLVLVASIAALVIGACDKKDGGSRALAPSACFGNTYANNGNYHWGANGQCLNQMNQPVSQNFCQNMGNQMGNQFGNQFGNQMGNGFNGYNGNCFGQNSFGNGFSNWNQMGGGDYATQWCNRQYGHLGGYFMPIRFGSSFNCLQVNGFSGGNNFNQIGFQSAFSSMYNFNPLLSTSGTPYIQGVRCGQGQQQDLDGDGTPACSCRDLSARILFFEAGVSYAACTDI